MKLLMYSVLVAVAMSLAVPAQAKTTVHGVAAKVVVQSARVVSYPVRHPKRFVRAFVRHL